nr:potassium channel subfamily U member 1 isoform X2 [Pogona vitticeps]
MAEHEHGGSHHLEDAENWQEDIGSHCTDYLQMAFISACLSIFLGGIIVIMMFRITESVIRYVFYRCHYESKIFSVKMPMLNYWKGHFQDWVVRMLSAQTTVGRVLVVLVFLFSIGSLIIYFINCYSVKQFCLSFEDQTITIDLCFNLFFLIYFGLRFLAASDKLAFWLELNSIVDFFTITPVCISFYLGKNWLGLRFLRALRLMELPKILQFLHVTTSGTAIKLSKLLAVFVSTWLTAAGFLHWMENSGDPWVKHKNFQNLSYFECLYLIMVTMSTVGYGDVVVKTTLGRVFILFFIVGGLILFANLVPEMADIVGSTKLYKGSYVMVKGRKFIVVCGNVTLNSVTAFLRDFLAQATGDVATEIIFLGENPPSLELETIFRCYAAYTSFFQGTVMKTEDLVRVQMEYAEACLILADTCSAQPYVEDTSNIMRVLSIKNHYPNTRVIIQIIQSSNKLYLPKLPNWDWKKGDSVICFAELKLGLIAQSCLVPGLTLLLTSLFIRESPQLQRVNVLMKHEQELQGQEYKVMTQLLSNDFVNVSFKEVCRMCFVKMNLILVAVEFQSGIHGNSLLINPSSTVKLELNTMGFFIAKSKRELRRARWYCNLCHNHVLNPELISKCRCKRKKGFSISGGIRAMQDLLHLQDPYFRSRAQGSISSTSVAFEEKPGEIVEERRSKTALDATGMFHWCEAVSFQKATLKRKKKTATQLRDHIVCCVFGDATSTLIGLRNFVMPLRASNFTFKELKDIVFVGSLEYLQREWEFIQNFPKLYILKGSALSCGDLRSASIKYCSMCAILSAHGRDAGDQTLVDTKSILATLNIRSLQFKLSPSIAEVVTGEASGNQAPQALSKRIPIITELKIASNAQFFEQSGAGKTDDLTENSPSHVSQGTIFSDSFLDSLLCTALVTGGTSPELEEYLAEETSLSGSTTNVTAVLPRNRCKLALVTISNTPFPDEDLMLYFGDVFSRALDVYGILCLGLYRLKEESNLYEYRYVIVRPPTNFEILATDQLFCLVPFSLSANDLTNMVKSFPKVKRKGVSKKKDKVILP